MNIRTIDQHVDGVACVARLAATWLGVTPHRVRARRSDNRLRRARTRAVGVPGSRPIAARRRPTCRHEGQDSANAPRIPIPAARRARRRERGEDEQGDDTGRGRDGRRGPVREETRVRYAKTDPMGMVCYAMSERVHHSLARS